MQKIKNVASAYHTHRELRKSFYDFFKSKNHEIVKSASVIPDDNDGTLLFTNAGMNQFKSLILSPSQDPRRVANIQKCIRAGGKHNDLDDVGNDLHHQTFFEMMGNWSFNDAFSKEDACRFAWEYLVEVLRIDADRLYVSYFGGIEHAGLPEDLECREIWRKIGVPSDRILPFVAENFWEMGAAGPCGPCTEIHFDRIGGRDAARLVNVDDSVVEIWNIVFMSNLRDSFGNIQSLGKNHVDTGMGFERLLSVVQNTNSNFDTDVFTPIISKISELTASRLRYNGSVSSREDAVFRLVADHVRAATVAISDDAKPDGVGPGFVIRKMMRRAFLQGSSKLGIERFAISELVPTVVDTLKDAYPEIENSSVAVQKLFQDEESQFWKTVDRAKKVFDGMSAENQKSSMFSGKDAFKLFETYGLPLSVTVELARNMGKSVDEKEFERCQSEARQLSKKASQFKLPLSSHDFPTHSDDFKYVYEWKDGKYEFPHVNAQILGIYKEQESAEALEKGEKGYLVLDNCQFYAEQGGQGSDGGKLTIDGNEVFQVESAKKMGGVTVLQGKATETIRKSEEVEQNLNESRREGLMRAHSATHLLNWALQKNGLGTGQKGSSVECDRLRFDYTTGDEIYEKRTDLLAQCEVEMNEFIRKGGATQVKETSLEQAKKIGGLQAEVKEDRIDGRTVRVVALGTGEGAPVECCSGTHVLDANHIVHIAIMSDKSIGQRARRIVALTGNEANECRKYADQILEKLENLEKSPKERAAIGKKIDWKRVPLVDQLKISSILKRKK